MKTKKTYLENVKNGIITEEMLSECLFSVNKRAKNCRDKAKIYRHQYDYAQKYIEQRDKYYEQKEILLSVVTPTEVHFEQVKRRDYIDDRYGSPCEGDKLLDIKECWDNSLHEKYQIYIIEEITTNIFLYYKIGNYSFHTPLLFNASAEQANDVMVKYGSLPHKEVSLITCGHSITELISMQFVRKVIELIQSGNYTYLSENV